MLHRLTAPWLDRSNYPLDWNGPARAFVPFADGETAIFDRFAGIARAHADRIAIDDGARRVTYDEVLVQATALAHRIAAQSAHGELIGLLLPTCAGLPIAMLACLGAGRLFVPLDAHYPQAWLAEVAKDCGMAAVIVRDSDAALVPPGVRRIDLEGPASPAALAPAALDAPAFVLFTSGSTGKPRGIVNSQRALIRRVAQYADAAHVDASDRFLPLSSACTIAGLRERFTALLSGATLHLIDVQREGARAILNRLREAQITMMYGVPALLRSLMQLDAGRPDALRVLRIGGDAVLWSDVDALRAWLPADCRIELGYSSTEAPIMQWFVPGDFPREGSRVPLGYPLAGDALAILDETGNAVTPGEAGELVVRSPHVALGRWQSGAIDATDFPADPNDPACRILRTGDLVKLRADGLIDLVGRKDRQIKIRGQRVEPGELEAAIRRRPGIRDVAVFPRRVGASWWLIAYVVGEADLVELKAVLRDALPAALQPQRLHRIDAIPRLASAKLDVKALEALDADWQRREVETAPAASAAPIGATEEAIAAIWRRLLDRDAIGRDDDFFDLGGDSLATLSLMFAIEDAFGLDLPVTAIFSAPTVATLAALVETRETGRFSLLVPIRAGEGAPLFIVHGVGGNVMELFAFGRQIDGARPVYAIQARGLDGRAPPARSIHAMADHYLAAIRAAIGDAPFHLAGYSSGGLVAFEIARRARPASLTLIDTQTNARQWPRAMWVAHLAKRARHHAAELVRLAPRAAARHATHAAMSFMRRLAWRVGLGEAPRIEQPMPLPPALQAVYDATLDAIAHYRPGKYDGPIALIVPARSDPFMADVALLWRDRGASLGVATVPGDHRSMVQGANAAALAAALSRNLVD